MKIKDEKGFSGIDITVAVIIILLFMSLITTVFYNITISSKTLERKTEATYIAVDVIEKIKALNYDDIAVKTYDDTNIGDIIDGYNATEGYSLSVTIDNYKPKEVQYENDVVKTINVKVEYKIGKNIESVELNTTVVREI